MQLKRAVREDIRSGRFPCPLLLMSRDLDIGGSQRQLTEVAKSIDRARFNAHVGCFLPFGIYAPELHTAGIPMTQFPVRSFKRPAALAVARQMGKYLRKHGIQIVHAFDVPADIFGVFAAAAYRTPIVISSQRAYRQLTAGPLLRMLRMTDRLADRIVVNCEAIRKHLIDDEGVPANRIRICYNGLDLTRFQSGPRWRPAELEGASLVIGVACGFRPEKGLPTLVDAFAAIAPLYPGSRLVLIGDGPCRPELQERCRNLRIADRCLFVPAQQEVERWLRALDVFVLPSLSEAFSNAIMEAMGCGCSVIASSVGGNPELVLEGETGLLFQAGNVAQLVERIKLLIENPELRMSMAGAGNRRMSREFSRERSIERMQAIYSELLERPS